MKVYFTIGTLWIKSIDAFGHASLMNYSPCYVSHQAMCPSQLTIYSIAFPVACMLATHVQALADLHSKLWTHAPPGRPNSFEFHAVFGRIWQNCMFTSLPRRVHAPTWGKSWIPRVPSQLTIHPVVFPVGYVAQSTIHPVIFPVGYVAQSAELFTLLYFAVGYVPQSANYSPCCISRRLCGPVS